MLRYVPIKTDTTELGKYENRFIRSWWDGEGTLCVPVIVWSGLGDLLSGALLVRKRTENGVFIFDWRIRRTSAACWIYWCQGLFRWYLKALSKWDWITHAIDSNFITIHYGNGRQAFSAGSYNASKWCMRRCYICQPKGGQCYCSGLSKPGKFLSRRFQTVICLFLTIILCWFKENTIQATCFLLLVYGSKPLGWSDCSIWTICFAFWRKFHRKKVFTLVNKETGQITRMMIDGYELRFAEYAFISGL